MIIQSINPATGQLNQEFETVSSEEAVLQCKKAHGAFLEWKKRNFTERAELLRRLAAMLRKNKRQYARLVTLEMGKPITQAQNEVEKCAWTAEVYAENAVKWLEEEKVDADGLRHKVIFEPLGVVLSIMPWNFPFWQVFRFGIPALAAGNVSVLRHSNVVPLCANAIGSVFTDAGFPENVFSVVITDYEAVGKMIASRYVAGVSLTGSEEAGKRIGALAGRYLKKCVLELGGSDPFIVLKDADVDKAAKAAASARTSNSGQSCIAAKRFIVVREIAEEFKEKMIRHMSALVVGDPLNEKTQVGPLATKQQFEVFESQVNDSIKEGAGVCCGGQRANNPGYFYEPTVLTNIKKSMRVWKEEVFGPCAPLFVVKNEREAVSVANDSELGLGASVWTADIEKGEELARQIEAGIVFVNHVVQSDPRMPFGGIKKSGVGRELSKYGLKEFVNVKGINAY